MFPASRFLVAASLAWSGVHAICIVGNASSCQVSLDWAIDPTTSSITFQGNCSSIGGVPITWCGFGISPGILGLMWPAESFVAQISGTTVVLEDRHNTAYASPTCQQSQLSVQGASTVSAAGDALAVSWTRPLDVNASLVSQGYISIPKGKTHAIGAILYGAAPPPYKFNATLTIHTSPGSVAVTFQ